MEVAVFHNRLGTWFIFTPQAGNRQKVLWIPAPMQSGTIVGRGCPAVSPA